MNKTAVSLGLATIASLALATPALADPMAAASPSPAKTAAGSPSASPSPARTASAPASSASTPATQSAATAAVARVAGAESLQSKASSLQWGAPAGEAAAFRGGSKQAFAAGTVYWSSGTGSHALSGAIEKKYSADAALQSSLGFPTSDVYTARNGVRAANFERGQIVESAGTGAQAVYGGIEDTYADMGSTSSPLGLPTTDEQNGRAAGSRVNRFTGGTITWTPSTGAREVHGAIGETYQWLGYEGSPLGVATSSERNGQAGARVNTFAGGVIVWSPSTGAHAVYGGIFSTYSQLNWEGGPLGKPLASEANGARGSRLNVFERGVIVWSPSTGAHEVYGGNYDRYASMGREGGALGKPASGEFTGARGARVNNFENGQIIWTPSTGSHAVVGPMAAEFGRRGYEGGSLGAPTSEAYDVPGGQEQKFQFGTLRYVNGQFSNGSQLKSSPNAVGNWYTQGSCVWYVYNRRAELGAPVSSKWGNAGQWANAARGDGYTVDHTPQVGAVISTYGFGASQTYGHVMVVESIAADGSFTVSQMNAPAMWQVSWRTFRASDAAQLSFIH